MLRLIALFIALTHISTARAAEPSVTPLSLSFWSPLSLPWSEPLDVYGLSLNIFHGRNQSVYGIEVGLIFNGIDKDFGGIQLAGWGNIVDGDFAGIQAAFVYAVVGGSCTGIQVGGLLVGCVGGGTAIQVGGLAALAGKGYVGLQVAGLFAQAEDPTFAIQLSLFNISTNRGAGVQAGFLNNGERGFAGVQIGGVNLNGMSLPKPSGYGCSGAGKCGAMESWTEYPSSVSVGFMLGIANRTMHFKGLQVGLINLARDVSGVQIGVFNSARNLSGLQIGLINLTTTGGLPFMIGINLGI